MRRGLPGTTLVEAAIVVFAAVVFALLAAAVWPYLDEPDPRTWPRLPWPDGATP